MMLFCLCANVARKSMPETIMVVALLADTHGFLDPRVAAVAQNADFVVHAGDIGIADILDELAAGGSRVIAVAGNIDVPDRWPTGDRILVERLPTVTELSLPGGTLAVEHGHRFPARTRHRRLRQAHPAATAVVCGHSHRRTIDRDAVPWVLNPGAAGRSRAYGGPGCLLLYASPAGWRVESRCFEPL